MCGRYVFDEATIAQVGLELRAEWNAPLPEARYNVAPSQFAPVVVEREGRRTAEMFRWGFQRTNRDTGGPIQLVNARAERVAWNFGEAFRHARCLVPASGFYEWRREGRAKRPHYIRGAGGGLLTFAGLWEPWQPDPEAEPIPSFVILTTAGNGFMAPIHERMPAILDGVDRDAWLSGAASSRELGALLRPAPDDRLVAHPVSSYVNDPANDGAECIAPLAGG
jgi:putative SOS response-associated peptidase YedK